MKSERVKPATVSFRYRALQQFFTWLADEEEVSNDPMARMKAPWCPNSQSSRGACRLQT